MITGDLCGNVIVIEEGYAMAQAQHTWGTNAREDTGQPTELMLTAVRHIAAREGMTRADCITQARYWEMTGLGYSEIYPDFARRIARAWRVVADERAADAEEMAEPWKEVYRADSV